MACWRSTDRPSRERGLSGADTRALEELRARWERIDAERRAGLGADTPPGPPRYRAADFADVRCWRLRGKLDVPAERFVSYPGCSPAADGSLLVGWAGWDPGQRREALLQVLAARRAQGGSVEELRMLSLD